VLEEQRSFYSSLHPSGGGGAFLGVVDYADKSVDIGPMLAWCDLNSKRIASIWFDALLPSDKTTEQRSAGGAGALSGDKREFRWSSGEVVELCER
jgi:hypothetical protein